ncbi:MAG TPA: DUF378 domain-containing protein [Candidatus Paceibacterota bacterium]|nr:DUF378 domain-containing protein [Candidatus Paceibacterota bacterium]
MKIAHMIAFILLVVGGLNWGLIGLSGFAGGGNWNAVNLLLGSWPMVEWAVYVLVGLSAIWLAVSHTKTCKECMGKV